MPTKKISPDTILWQYGPILNSFYVETGKFMADLQAVLTVCENYHLKAVSQIFFQYFLYVIKSNLIVENWRSCLKD